MDPAGITPEHAAIVGATVIRQLRYLGKLRTRMERAGMSAKDGAYPLVVAAYNAAHALRVELHYLSCKPGAVARRGDDPPSQ